MDIEKFVLKVGVVTPYYISFSNRVRGPYCKLRTKFPFDLWPKHEAISVNAYSESLQISEAPRNQKGSF